MLLELAVRSSHALRTDITDIEPDPGIIGAEAVGTLNGLIGLVFWVVLVGLVLAFAWTLLLFAKARRNNPQQTEAARNHMFAAIGALVLFGGLSTIVGIATGLLA